MSALKLKGSRLESEVDKCRGECNWDRLRDILPAVRARGSGHEGKARLIEGELQLELFLSNEEAFPKSSNHDLLRGAEESLIEALADAKSDTKPDAKLNEAMETHLLLAKLYFYCFNFHETIHHVEQSRLDVAKTQFVTLRSLKLAAEGYALKGFAIERTTPKNGRSVDSPPWKRVLGCFETATELAISYIAELEKSFALKQKLSPLPLLPSYGNVKIGALLELAVERTPYLSLKRCWNEKKGDLEGVEWYRRIMTELGDKCMVDKLQLRLCRQLAEILLRGIMDRESCANYEYASRAIASKAKSLSFYTGSNRSYFAPRSRLEEIILLLMISEIIVSQNMRVSPAGQSERNGKLFSLSHLKTVQNLLVLVLSNLRQYHLLSSIYDRAMRFAIEDRHMWTQYSLTLLCENRFPLALKVLERASTQAVGNGVYDESDIIESMLLARLQLDHLGDVSAAMRTAQKALVLSTGCSWLAGRCMLLLAAIQSVEARHRHCYEERRKGMLESIKKYERAIELDPHDEKAHLLCALEYALFRDLNAAKEKCHRCLELCAESPLAVMLMALLFTTKHDYKSALELVINSLIDFPSHYGLLVMRLKLESKYGLIEEVMQTAKKLLCFWQNASYISSESTSSVDEEPAANLNGYSTIGSKSAVGRQLAASVRTASKEVLLPGTPIFVGPLGIAAASSHSLAVANSQADINEAASTLGRSFALSEQGLAATPTLTDGSTGGLLNSSGPNFHISASAFRAQADIWVELAEFFLEMDRVADVKSCINEVYSLFPHAHQTHYMKGRLCLATAEKMPLHGENSQRQRLLNEARCCFLAALSLQPSHTPSYLQLSKVYAANGGVDMAEKALRSFGRLIWRMFVRHARLLSASLLSRSSHSSTLNVETVDALRARLLYQSKKRGIKENDIIIGGFADVHLAGMNAEQLHAYEKIINGGYMEWDLYYYLAGRKDPPLDLRNCRVFAKMKDFANTPGKQYN